MANTESGSGPGVVIAFVAGALVGAAVALLLAPATGEETRECLGERAREGRKRASDAARQGRDVMSKQRDNLVEAFERGKRAYQTASDGAEEEQKA